MKENEDTHGTQNKNSQIKSKTSMLKSILYDYSDTYILVIGTTTTDGERIHDNAKQLHEMDKGVIVNFE